MRFGSIPYYPSSSSLLFIFLKEASNLFSALTGQLTYDLTWKESVYFTTICFVVAIPSLIFLWCRVMMHCILSILIYHVEESFFLYFFYLLPEGRELFLLSLLLLSTKMGSFQNFIFHRHFKPGMFFIFTKTKKSYVV